MARSFLYKNGNIRIGKEPATHREGSKEVNWFAHSENVWKGIDWNRVRSYITINCHGSSSGAKFIENTLNLLDKYTGKNSQQQQLTQADRDALGVTSTMEAALLANLRDLDLGSSTAQSLLRYLVTEEGLSTAENAGFSFEKRLSELIYRLAAGNTEGSQQQRLAYRSGGRAADVGNTAMFVFGSYDSPQSAQKAISSGKARQELMKFLLDDLGEDCSDFIGYTYRVITDELDKTKSQIAIMSYKVPSKADITVPQNLAIHATYGPTIGRFLREIQGKQLSLKNTHTGKITVGSTNDNVRLRGFAEEFLTGIDKSFGNLSTFIFASKNSQNETVQGYLDWGRIIYELTGVSQNLWDPITGTSQNILVDYLVVNNYDVSGTGGKVSVFSVKDFFTHMPSTTTEPFKFENKAHTGRVETTLTNLLASAS